jgi:fermentation-respiration switch protein FrsA (DUF1100 family)
MASLPTLLEVRKVVRDFAKLIGLPSVALKAMKDMIHRKLNGLNFQDTDLIESLGKAKVSDVLVVHDKLDPSVHFESAEAIFEKYDHTSLLVTKGQGHFYLMRHPEVIRRVINFVKESEEVLFS